jgi:EAL domain-containing protein (putative c-di-GMP-specific phosphodiesterase class I)
MKPFGPQQLVDVVADAVRLRRLESKKREALEQVGGAGQAADREELESAFWKTLSSIEVAYEPVRVASSGELFGYVAAPHANDPKQSYRDTLIGTAQQVDRLRTLGRTVRNRIAFFLRTLPATVATMVPIHAHDLQDGSLAVADNLFAKHASRLVLEVAGGVPHDALASLHGRVASIRKLGFRFAADGLMATPSSLVAFAIIRPEILRIDFARLRGVARDLGVQAVVRGLVQLATAIGAQVLAEGLEEEVERESVIQLGCQLLHGPLVR